MEAGVQAADHMGGGHLLRKPPRKGGKIGVRGRMAMWLCGSANQRVSQGLLSICITILRRSEKYACTFYERLQNLHHDFMNV